LIPKDCPDTNDGNLNGFAINAQYTLNTLSDRNPFVIIFLIDCQWVYHLRNHDLDRRDPNTIDPRSADLQPMYKAGLLITFACAPGTTAK
jgi:hypothetical protein